MDTVESDDVLAERIVGICAAKTEQEMQGSISSLLDWFEASAPHLTQSNIDEQRRRLKSALARTKNCFYCVEDFDFAVWSYCSVNDDTGKSSENDWAASVENPI